MKRKALDALKASRDNPELVAEIAEFDDWWRGFLLVCNHLTAEYEDPEVTVDEAIAVLEGEI